MSRSEQPVAPRLRPDNPAARAATRASQHGADHEGGAHRPVRMHPRSYPHPRRRCTVRVSTHPPCYQFTTRMGV